MKQVWQKIFAHAWTTPAPLVAALVLLFSVAAAEAQERSRLDEVLQRGSLIVVTLGTVPPFAFKDDKGELVGFDIDVARLAANALFRDPNKIEFVIVTSDGRWPAIESGRADMGVGGTTVYPDRAIRVAFTRAFIDSGISIMVAKSAGIKSLEELNQEKYTVANLNNPQMADRAQMFFPKAKIITFDTPSGEFLAVKSGRAHALQIDTPTADYFAATSATDFEVLPTLLTASQNNGIYLKPGDFKWWLWLDTFVSELRTGSLYPRYAEIYQKWFKKDPPPQKFYLPPAR
ncbi:MAG TPA: transporter substrate-binding domain-containing protein [Hyphomicrobiaceae bacterium]|jgi:polar amino acid transport system substrate-binding protein|nr:transporter substrate-binding domain-containing protein [Hyphomicrobiaceae bacterium]